MANQNAPNPSEIETFITKFANYVIQWAPLGGSGGVMLSLLLKQEWLLSALLSPVTAFALIWGSYSKNFIDQLKSIYAERGKNDATSFVRWLDSLNETLKWQFSGFEKNYLKAQSEKVSEYLTEGFNPDRTAIPLLEEVYVPLELSGYGVTPTVRASELATATDSLSIWDILKRSHTEKQFRQIVIQARGGFGKTTLLRHVAWMFGCGKYKQHDVKKKIPFLLHLRDWQGELTRKEPPALMTLLQEYVESIAQEKSLKIPPKWVEQTLGDGEALVMLDGFDEIPEKKRGSVSHWIRGNMNAHANATFILTSRPEGFKTFEAQKPRTPLFVKKFTLEQQSDFIERWYLCQEKCFRSPKQHGAAVNIARTNAQNLLAQLHDEDRPELQQMAENPLLLNMLATYHRFDTGVELPHRKVDLYQGICKLLLKDRPRARGIAMVLESDKSQGILQTLALKMVYANTASISHAELLKFLNQDSTLKAEKIEGEEYLKEQVSISELLVEKEAGEYEFPHLSFQGYLASVELYKQSSESEVLSHWDESWWKETILLYTNQLSPLKFSDLIRQAYVKSDAAANLAAQCFRNYQKPDKLDPDLKDLLSDLAEQLQESVLQTLDQLLKNGQWEKADEETYRLMIETVDKEVGQCFTKDDLLNFPCDILLAIDELWVKHSGGQFGFSVQKGIYLECGGILDGEYHSEAFNKYLVSVGWRSLKYSQKSPKGHLPFVPVEVSAFKVGDRFGGLLDKFEWWVLFSRIQACKV